MRQSKKQLAFLKKARPTGINIGILYPLHATVVYEQAEENGSLIGTGCLSESLATTERVNR
jgi:hypothetical protein